MMRIIPSFIIGIFMFSCQGNEISLPENLPSCVEMLKQKSNPPLEIWRYKYNNKYVYLALADCCDQYDYLYDSNCNIICAPSGGFSGQGDGKCLNFADKAKDGALIWKKN